MKLTKWLCFPLKTKRLLKQHLMKSFSLRMLTITTGKMMSRPILTPKITFKEKPQNMLKSLTLQLKLKKQSTIL